MKRKRLAPTAKDSQKKKKSAKEFLGMKGDEKPDDYEPMRPDKKKLLKPTKEEIEKGNAAIDKKMKERFGPNGGKFIIKRIIKGELL